MDRPTLESADAREHSFVLSNGSGFTCTAKLRPQSYEVQAE